MRETIDRGLSKFSKRVSSSVPYQEFKRRLLHELVYLLAKLEQTQSYLTTLSHVTSLIPQQQQRKTRVCLPLLHNVLPGASDAELTERGRRYFRFLLTTGEDQFKHGLDALLPGLNCFWSRVSIVEKRRYKRYEMGNTRCSKTKKQCEIGKELNRVLPSCKELHKFLCGLPANRMTVELENARDFLDRILNGTALHRIHDEDACLKFGDLLIAIESASIENFYTMNYRESQAFCDFFKQSLTVRPNNPANNDVTYTAASKPWPTL
jgi:hypothetical protein